jgi:hypothetical protein
MASHCDGREFYFVGDWREPTGGIAREHEPAALELFCAQHKPLTADQISAGIRTTHPATFLVLEENSPVIDILRRRYPSAQIIQQRSDDRFLFTSVDVSADDLAGLGAGADSG